MLALLTLAHAATLTVGSGGYPSIQAAIDASASGDTVIVDPGTWTGTVDLRGHTIALRSRDGAASTVLAGGAGAWTVLYQSGEAAGSSLRGFTIANPGGAGVYVGGGADVAITELAFTGNGAFGSWTPAFQVSGANATVTDTTFSGNGSQYGGAVLVDTGAVHLENVSFTGDTAWYGGAVFVSTAGSAIITDCSFTGESAYVGGGAVYVSAGASSSVATSTFDGNTTDTGHGGAVYVDTGAMFTDVGGRYVANEVLNYDTLGTVGGAVFGTTATLSFAGSTFEGNTAYRGGGFYATGGTVALDTVSLEANYAIQGGAGWLSEGAALTDQGSTWDKNTSYDVGGALVGYNTFSASLTDAVFTENLATYSHAGAIYGGTVGTLSCSGCTFRENTAYYYGGAIFLSELYGAASVTDSTFDQNVGTYGYGGAVFAQYYSDLTVAGSTFSSNHAYSGGGVYTYYRTDLAISDSSFSRNAASAYAGGAIYAYDAGLADSVLTLTRVEVDDNSAFNEGGGLVVAGMDVATISDSRFLRNSAGNASFGGAIFAQGNGTVLAAGNQITANGAGYGGGVYVDTPARRATWTNNRFMENAAGIGGAFCVVGGGGAVWTNNTFVGNGASEAGGTGCLYATTVAFRNNVVAWTDPMAAVYDYSADSAAQSDYGYNAWFGNVAGDSAGEAGDVTAAQGALTKDPRLVGYTRDGDDTNDNLRLLRDSPLVDAGDPDVLDPDGTRSDMGAFGGPGAPAGDADGDGFDASADCDDADPAVYPGAADAPYDGVNGDCTGVSDYDADADGEDALDYGGADCDDADPAVAGPCEVEDTGKPPRDHADPETEPSGCGCASGAVSPGWLALGLAATLLRRRRSR